MAKEKGVPQKLSLVDIKWRHKTKSSVLNEASRKL